MWILSLIRKLLWIGRGRGLQVMGRPQDGLHFAVRRILRNSGYPPDKQEKATQTVLEQAKLLYAEWAV